VQFRVCLPGANLGELKEFFELRQEFLKKILSKVDKIGNGFIPYMQRPTKLIEESAFTRPKPKKLEDCFAEQILRFQMDM